MNDMTQRSQHAHGNCLYFAEKSTFSEKNSTYDSLRCDPRYVQWQENIVRHSDC